MCVVAMSLTALEFYSGMGGMHCALKLVAPAAVVLDAFDINHAANRCYEHNFDKPPKQVDIEHMTAKELDAYGADLWMLAPPCQPFTRQGMQRGAQDNRSKRLCTGTNPSPAFAYIFDHWYLLKRFLNILNQIPLMKQPPSFLLLENVVGFETSDMHGLLTECLAESQYHMSQFILTPIQYGVPYSRPRYFCLASKYPFPVTLPAAVQPCLCTPSLLLQLIEANADQQALTAAAQQTLASHVQYVCTIEEFLSDAQQQACSAAKMSSADRQHQSYVQAGPLDRSNQRHPTTSNSCSNSSRQPAERATSVESHADMWVPDAVISKHADVIDVVTAASRSCNCFTKAYGKLARGAGSMLATVDPAAVDAKWKLANRTGSLYYEGYTGGLQGTADGSSSKATIDAQTSSDPEHSPEPTVSTSSMDIAGSVVGISAPQTDGVFVEGATPPVATHKEGLIAAWRLLKLRYFTPREVACLHSFPGSFSFPADMSPRQCYKLLGNSLNVAVVADLLKFLLQATTGSR